MPRPRTHRCAAPDCRHDIPTDRLMCRPHWHALPPALRSAIEATKRFGDKAGWIANVRHAERLLAGDDGDENAARAA